MLTPYKKGKIGINFMKREITFVFFFQREEMLNFLSKDAIIIFLCIQRNILTPNHQREIFQLHLSERQTSTHYEVGEFIPHNIMKEMF